MAERIRTLSAAEARRIAVRAQLLDAGHEARDAGDLPDVVARLTMLPLNPTEIVSPSAEHIAHTRIRSLAFDDVRRAVVLEQLRQDGPLPQAEISDSADAPYASTGWNTARDVAMLLELLQIAGRVTVVERLGQARVWDLAERVHRRVEPAELEEAERTWRERWLASLGVARPTHLGDAGEPVRIEGVRGHWRLDPRALDEHGRPPSAEAFAGRVAVLSPHDRLIADRRRMVDLWSFEYALEQYAPAAKRRWGAYALPILDGIDLVGKVDAKADREAGALRVHRIHWDVDADARLADAAADELAAFLGLRLAMP